MSLISILKRYFVALFNRKKQKIRAIQELQERKGYAKVIQFRRRSTK